MSRFKLITTLDRFAANHPILAAVVLVGLCTFVVFMVA